MADLERALQIAVEAHKGQKDKNGKSYIFHPIRVMTRCATADAKMAALLHDVVEDTDITFDDLKKEGFSDRLIELLKLLTHDPDVSYEEYVQKIASDATAIEVKLADLEDNSDIRRLQEIDEKTTARLKKYLTAYQFLVAKREEMMG